MSNTTPWYTNFPTPRSSARALTDEEVATLMRDPAKKAGKDYVIVDVRRTDFEVPFPLSK